MEELEGRNVRKIKSEIKKLYDAGYSIPEIAEKLNIPERIVSTFLSEIRLRKAKGGDKMEDTVEMNEQEKEFLSILRDVGIRMGARVITKVVFAGDPQDPDWVERVLSEYKVPPHKIRLILAAWFGKFPEDLGVEIKEEEEEESDMGSEIKKMRKRLFELLELQYMERMFNRLISAMGDSGKTQQQATAVRRIMRPVVDKDGNIVTDNNGNPLYTVVEEPVAGQMAYRTVTQTVDPFSAFATMVNAIAKLKPSEEGTSRLIEKLIDKIEEATKPKEGATEKMLREELNRLRDELEKLRSEQIKTLIASLYKEVEKLKEQTSDPLKQLRALRELKDVLEDLKDVVSVTGEKKSLSDKILERLATRLADNAPKILDSISKAVKPGRKEVVLVPAPTTTQPVYYPHQGATYPPYVPPVPPTEPKEVIPKKESEEKETEVKHSAETAEQAGSETGATKPKKRRRTRRIPKREKSEGDSEGTAAGA